MTTTKKAPAKTVKKAARKATGKAKGSDQRMAGCTVVFDTHLAKAKPDHLSLRVGQLGGSVLADVAADTTMVVHLRTRAPGKVVSKAKKLIEQGAAIEILTDHDFCSRYVLTVDEVVAMLNAGAGGVADLENLTRYHHPAAQFVIPPIENAKLAGMKLGGRYLRLTFDKCDLTGSELAGYLDRVTNCCLRQAHFEGAYIGNLEGSDLRESNIREVRCSNMSGTDLSKLDLHEVDWSQVDLSESKLTGANLASAVLARTNLSGAVLESADLSSADLSDAKLDHADLRRAKLRGTMLGGADLTGAMLDGADFTGANLASATLPEPIPDGVIGLDPQACADQKGRIDGPCLSALDAVSRSAKKLKTSARVKLPDGTDVALELDARGQSYVYTRARTKQRSEGATAESLTAAMLAMVRRYGHGQLAVDSISQQSGESPIKGKDLTRLVVDAWCESFGVASPHGNKTDGVASKTAALLADVASSEGMARLNETLAAMSGDDRSLNTADFGGQRVAGLRATGIDLSLCRFKQATLTDAVFTRCKLDHAVFESALLEGVTFDTCSMKGTNWSDAKVTGSAVRHCAVVGATLTNARFEEVDMTGSELDADAVRGAAFVRCDFSGANLSGLAKGAEFKGGRFDRATKLPPQFVIPADMDGPREADGSKIQSDESMDLTTFMSRLRATVHKRDLDKALQMLRKSTFHLYSMVDVDQVVSIVKSPSDPTRFYACRLGERVHSCGTQRLNPCSVCGRGPCKHMLVMIVGLARTGQVNLSKLDGWVQTSMPRYAEFDKDQLADLFLRYSNAQAGEIDWRPTETIPEDYYAI